MSELSPAAKAKATKAANQKAIDDAKAQRHIDNHKAIVALMAKYGYNYNGTRIPKDAANAL